MVRRRPSDPPILPGFSHVRVLGSGGFADVFGEDDGSVVDGFFSGISGLRGHGDFIFGGAQFDLFGFECYHQGFQGGDLAGETGKDRLLGSGGEDGFDAGDEGRHGEVP